MQINVTDATLDRSAGEPFQCPRGAARHFPVRSGILGHGDVDVLDPGNGTWKGFIVAG